MDYDGGLMGKRYVAVIAILVALAAGAYVTAFGWPWGARDLLANQRTTRPPPEVGIVVAEAAEVPLPVEYAGRIVGVRDVEVRALVGGLLLKRDFEEGDKVTQGQRLPGGHGQGDSDLRDPPDPALHGGDRGVLARHHRVLSWP